MRAKGSFFRVVDGVDHVLLKIEEIFLVIVTLALIAAIFIEVVCRYVFFVSTAWSEELARYLFIALTFLGSSYAYARREHIEIDVISQVAMSIKGIKNKALVQRILRILANVSTSAFVLVFAHIFFQYLLKIKKMNLLSPTMHVPMVIVYFTVYLGCILTLVHAVFMLLRDLFEKEDTADRAEKSPEEVAK